MNDETQKKLRELPGVSTLLDEMSSDVSRWGHEAVTSAARDKLASLRSALKSGEVVEPGADHIAQSIRNDLQDKYQPALRAVFNLTGIVIHSNLGRAKLPAAAIAAISDVVAGASNLEYDLKSGSRGDRDSHIEAIICELTGAEAATAVNNNAAAVLLTLNTFAMGKHVPVSRGELVEIGGSFRVPDIMSGSGCKLIEVGTTNRTHLQDYEKAIDENTALLMRVHTSNYRIEGFTAEVSERDLASLAHQHNLPFVVDMGCGNLIDLPSLGLPHEATAQQTLKNGADLVLFSGDKLLGGPQAGIIAGRADLIAQLKANPLKRALRLDKMAIAALEATLQLYYNPDELVAELPTLRLLTRPASDINEQARRLVIPVSGILGTEFEVDVAEVSSQIGSGSLPVEVLPSAALRIRSAVDSDQMLRELNESLRALPKPIISRLSNGSLLLDLRCLEVADEYEFIEQFSELGQ